MTNMRKVFSLFALISILDQASRIPAIHTQGEELKSVICKSTQDLSDEGGLVTLFM